MTISIGADSTRAGSRARPPGAVGLNSSQRRIWFQHVRGYAGDAHHLSSVLRIEGPLDVPRLRAALTAIVRRHAVLASTYHADDRGEPYRIAAAVSPEFSDMDLGELDDDVARRRAEVIRRRDVVRHFDLARCAPLRTTLLRLGPTEHLLMIAAHAIAWDDQSLQSLLWELAQEYGTPPRRVESTDRAHADAVPPRPDGIDRDFWRTTLEAAPEPAQMVTGSGENDCVTTALDPELLRGVRRFAESAGVELDAVLMAVHDVLVLRYTGAGDIVTAIPVAATTGAAIGQHGNTVLVRTKPTPERAFGDHLADVALSLRQAMARSADGIDAVVEAVRPVRTHTLDGLAQLSRVGFAVYQPVVVPDIADLTISVEDVGRQRPTADWHLAVDIHPERPTITVTARGARTRDYPEHYVNLLAESIAAPHREIGQLRMLDRRQRAAVLAASRGVDEPHEPTTITEILQRVAASVPDRVAVQAHRGGRTETITYRALDEGTNRLARHLVTLGIGPDDVVGLSLTRSVESVVAICAVLKAGAAYAPIDPDYPADRIAHLHSDAHPVLSWDADDVAQAQALAAGLDSSTITDADRIAPLRPGNLAYVMYTSGSTGTPKGVAVAHAEIADHVTGFGKQWALPGDSRVLATSSVSFDASLLDLFVTLSLGATVVLPDPQSAGDVTHLGGLIAEHRITMLHTVPSLLRELMSLPQRTEWRSVSHVAVGGDRLDAELAERVLAEFDVELRNYYGPTEAVVSSTHHRVRSSAVPLPVVPIGRPNRNVDAYVLDGRLELTADGVLGELYLGGNQLARGYFERPSMTSAHFVADPFTPGARLYRTGDLVRRGADGVLEFIGRSDDQVKIRGYRVELGEVAAALTSHRDVVDCHVIGRLDPAGDMTLHAYLAGRSGSRLDPAHVRAAAARYLPEVMLPTAYAVVDTLPRAVSGKVDVSALPDTKPIGTQGSTPIRSAAEREVGRVYADFFGTERVHANDSFFDLGGHSLNALRFLATLRDATGVTLTAAELFSAPTVAGVAVAVEADRDRRPDRGGVGGPASTEPVPATAASELAWRAGSPNASTVTVWIDGPIDRARLAAAIADVGARHDATRLLFREGEHGGRLLLDVDEHVDYAEELESPAASRSADTEFTVGAPLWRFRLTALNAAQPASSRLTVTAHRAAADDFSLRTVVREIAHTYAGGAAGRPTHSFIDYARWYAAAARSDDSAVGWWRAAYAGIARRRSLGVEAHSDLAPQPDVVDCGIDSTLRRRLQAAAARAGIAERSLYEAAVAVAAHLLGHGDDVVLGGLAGRDAPVAATLVGPVDGACVVRYDLACDPNLAAVLDQARLTVHGAQTAVGTPTDIHRATALAAEPGLPRLAATVRFDADPQLDNLAFGPRIRGGVDSSSPPNGDVQVVCRAGLGTLDLTVSVPDEARGADAPTWCRTIRTVLDALATEPELRLSDLDTDDEQRSAR